MNAAMVIVEIAGPTGSGKTTLVRQIAGSSSDIGCVSEPSFDRIHQPLAQQDWSLTQREILKHRARQLSSMPSRPLLLADRFFSEDREVFFELHFDLGHISRAGRDGLSKEARRLEARFPPSCILFLQAPQEVLLRRMVEASQPDWLLASLDRQLVLYAEWLSRRPDSVILDSSEQTPAQVAIAALEILRVRGFGVNEK
jgi:deoxyadenosine/deoxycytidine kinase